MWFYWVIKQKKHTYHLFSLNENGRYFYYLKKDNHRSRQIRQTKFVYLRNQFFNNASQITDYSEAEIYL